MTAFGYHRAVSVDDACSQLDDEAAALAGGTDLLPLVKTGLRSPERLVDIKRSGLPDAIVVHDDHIELGALVTLAAVERDDALATRLPALTEATAQAATPQIRHRATIGGTILQRPRCWYFRTPEVSCWLEGGTDCPARTGRNEHHAIFHDSPCAAVHPSDLAAPLMALDAVVHLRSDAGTRTEPLAYLLAPPTDERRTESTIRTGELITAIEIDTSRPTISAYRKAMDRKAWAFALAGAAVVARFEGDRLATVRIVLSGVANIPHPATDSEEVLLRRGVLDADTIERAAAVAVEHAEPLAHNGYKRQLVTSLVRDALNAVAARR